MRKISFESIEKLDFQINEAYKTLRTNIQFCGEEIKVITFTSCMPNEGKSTVVFHLASSMAEGGKKVLMIDADIRNSVTIARYQVNKKVVGLSEYLTGQCELDECLYETNVKNMDIIFTGPVAPNPSELLGTSKFADMLETLRPKYDYILLDCPPLGNLIDAAVVSTYSDGAIFIIATDEVSYKFAQQVKKQIEKSGCKIIGAILNKADTESKRYYNKNYGNYYNAYVLEDEEANENESVAGKEK